MDRMTWDEQVQRRVDTMEWWPSVMTEDERIAKRRFEAYFAFETQNWRDCEPPQA
jgi:hypothetical protein